VWLLDSDILNLIRNLFLNLRLNNKKTTLYCVIPVLFFDIDIVYFDTEYVWACMLHCTFLQCGGMIEERRLRLDWSVK